MMITELSAYQNRTFKGALKLLLPNGGLPFALASTYVLNFYVQNNTTPFAVATVGGTTAAMIITQTGVLSRVEWTLAASLMTGLEGYGSIELLDTATSLPVTVLPCRFVKEGTAYIPEFGAELVVWAETVVCVVNAYYTGTDTPANAIDNPRLADMASQTFKGRLSAGVGDPEDLTVAQMQAALISTNSLANEKAQAALNAFSGVVLGNKATLINLGVGGYYALDDQNLPIRASIETVAGVVITSPAGLYGFTRKKKLLAGTVNALQKNHDVNGSPIGDQIWPAITYLNTRTSPAFAAIEYATALTAGAAPSGYALNAAHFGDNSTNRFCGQAIAVTAGQLICGSYLIVMADGSQPAIGAIGSATDFSIYGPSAINPSNPDTGTVNTAKITGPFAGNVYLCEAYWTVGSAGTYPVGIDKRTTSTNKQFDVLWMQVAPGRYPSPLVENTTATPITRAADVRSIPLANFDSSEITLLAEFVMPNFNAATNAIVNLSATALNDRLTIYVSAQGSVSALVRVAGAGVATLLLASGLVAGTKYRLAAAIDQAVKTIRGKVTGIAAPAEAAITALMPAPIAVQIGNVEGTNQLSGAIANVGLIDRALSPAEIASWVG